MKKAYILRLNNNSFRLYCHECKKGMLNPHEVRETTNDDPKSPFYEWKLDPIESTRYNYIKKFRCPNCGAEYDANDVKPIGFKKWDTEFSHACVFDNGDKVVLKLSYKQVKPAMDHLLMRFMDERIVINVKTGHTYVLAPWAHGKPVKEFQGRKCTDITYMHGARVDLEIVPEDKKKELYELVKTKMQEIYGPNVGTLEQFYFEQMLSGERVDSPYSPYDTISYNRMPSMAPTRWNRLTSESRNEGRCSLNHRLVKLRYTDDPVNNIIDAYKAERPTQAVHDALMRNPVQVYQYMIGKLFLDTEAQMLKYLDESKSAGGTRYLPKYANIMKDFLNDVKSAHGIHGVIGLLGSQYYSRDLNDIARRYRKIKAAGAVIDMNNCRHSYDLNKAINKEYDKLYPPQPPQISIMEEFDLPF